MLRKSASVACGSFCLAVPLLALLVLFNSTSPFGLNETLSQGVEVAAVSEDGEVVELVNWQDTACLASSPAIDCLSDWEYSSGPNKSPNPCSGTRRSETRPGAGQCNIYVVKIEGGCRAFGSRPCATACGPNVTPVNIDQDQNRFQNLISLRRPQRYQRYGIAVFGVNGLGFDISTIFDNLLAQHVDGSNINDLQAERLSNIQLNGDDEIDARLSALFNLLESRR